MTCCKTWWHVYWKHRKGWADKWDSSHFEKLIPTFDSFPCVRACALFRSSFISIFRVLKLFSPQMSQNALPSICSWDIIMKLTVSFDTSLMWEEWTHFIQLGTWVFGFLHLQCQIFWTGPHYISIQTKCQKTDTQKNNCLVVTLEDFHH